MEKDYELQSFYSALHAFCVVDLSAFSFDIRKDVLYCDKVASLRRRAVRTVMDIVFKGLVHWLSPVLCFTTEEAWQARYGEKEDSLQLFILTNLSERWFNTELAQRIDMIREQRRVITGAIEQARSQGILGSSLQAEVFIYDPKHKLVPDVDFTEFAIVSKVTIISEVPPDSAWCLPDMPDLSVVVRSASGEKCQRCWRVLEEVGQQQYPDLCQRCDNVVDEVSSFTYLGKE